MTPEDDARKPTPQDQEHGAGDWKLSWRRFLEFGKNILDLERSVASLKAENKELRGNLRDLQRQVDKLSGEMKAVSQCIRGAMADKIDTKVEKAEIRAFERLLSMVRGSSREIE